MYKILLSLFLIGFIQFLPAQNRNNGRQNARSEKVLEITNSAHETLSYIYVIEDMDVLEIAEDGSLTVEASDILGDKVLAPGDTHTLSMRSVACTVHIIGQSDTPRAYVLRDVNICEGSSAVSIGDEECVANCEDGAEDQEMDEDPAVFQVRNETGVNLSHLFSFSNIDDVQFNGNLVDPSTHLDLLGEEFLAYGETKSISVTESLCEVSLFANGEDDHVYFLPNVNICDGEVLTFTVSNIFDYESNVDGDAEFYGAGLYTVKNLTRKQISFLYAFPEGAETSDVEGMEDYLGDQILNPGQSIEVALKFPSETTQFVAVFEDQTRMVVELTICDGCPEELVFRNNRR